MLTTARTGRHRVRRTYIPKGGSSTEKRPIGIPTFSDKVLQRAVAMILEPIYEHDFHDGLVRLSSGAVGPSGDRRPAGLAEQATAAVGCWTRTCESISIRSTAATCGSFFSVEFGTACCCV